MQTADAKIWASSENTIKRSQRYYAHFDYRTDLSKCWKDISDPNSIIKHSFYPFIHYLQTTEKFSKNEGRKRKEREICYASHIDRCIYQYYNYLLNNLYNDRCRELDISNTAVAYRTNLKKQSNIHFANRAIGFIQKSEDCYVMIGDFTKFFDNLDHQYLKRQWCAILKESKLPEDHYAIYKNITRYSWIELTDIMNVLNIEDTKAGRKKLNAMRRIFSPEELRSHKKLIQKNKDSGIPQGSPLSGVLANIYMLEADKKIHDLVSSSNGLYMRYSDDFIIVLPHLAEAVAVEGLKEIKDLFNGQFPGLELQSKKTQYYHFSNNMLVNCGTMVDTNADCSNRYLNFLGFTFDGNKISVRSKTISKYYYRMRRKAKTILTNDHYTKTGKHISGENLYRKYSERGSKGKTGNFLSYIDRAELEFGSDQAIQRDVKRHMAKIRKAISK